MKTFRPSRLANCGNGSKENAINYGTYKKNSVEYVSKEEENSTDNSSREKNSIKNGITQKGAINNGTEKDATSNGTAKSNINKCDPVHVKREIGLFSAVTMTLGAIIGAGIFVSPKGILENSGSVGCSLVIWVVMGLFSMLGAACYIELGTTFPKSGTDFTYIKECLGDLPAFMYLWVRMVCATPAGIAIVSLTFANYVLESFFPNCVPSPMLTRIVAALPVCE